MPSGPTSLDVTSTACDAEVLIAASQLGPSFGILDTGATKTAIGSPVSHAFDPQSFPCDTTESSTVSLSSCIQKPSLGDPNR